MDERLKQSGQGWGFSSGQSDKLSRKREELLIFFLKGYLLNYRLFAKRGEKATSPQIANELTPCKIHIKVTSSITLKYLQLQLTTFYILRYFFNLIKVSVRPISKKVMTRHINCNQRATNMFLTILNDVSIAHVLQLQGLRLDLTYFLISLTRDIGLVPTLIAPAS